MNLMGVQMIAFLTILKTEFCRVEQVRAKVKTTPNSMTAKTLRQVTCQTVQPQKDCPRGRSEIFGLRNRSGIMLQKVKFCNIWGTRF